MDWLLVGHDHIQKVGNASLPNIRLDQGFAQFRVGRKVAVGPIFERRHDLKVAQRLSIRL